MTEHAPKRLEEYRELLKWLTRRMQLDPRLQRRFDSSDLVQETMLKAQANVDEFERLPLDNRIKWLQTILNNVLIDEVRNATAQKRDYRLEQSIHTAGEESAAKLDDFLAAVEPGPDGQLQREEALLQLAEAMNKLPEDQSDAVLLRYQHHMTVAEIAARLGRTERSVAGLLQRGRENLRHVLSDSN